MYHKRFSTLQVVYISLGIIGFICFLLMYGVTDRRIKFFLEVIAMLLIPIGFLNYYIEQLINAVIHLKQNRYKVNRNAIGILTLLIRVMVLVLSVYVPFFFGGDKFQDVSYALESNYSTITGAIEGELVVGTHDRQTFEIDDIIFVVDINDFEVVKEGEVYSVEYYPNSKYVLSIEKVDK